MSTHTQSCAYVHCYVVLHYYSTVVRCDYQLVFNVDPKTLNKGERLEYGESMMTHAMVLTAVNEKQVSHQSVTISVRLHGQLQYMLCGIFHCNTVVIYGISFILTGRSIHKMADREFLGQ